MLRSRRLAPLFFFFLYIHFYSVFLLSSFHSNSSRRYVVLTYLPVFPFFLSWPSALLLFFFRDQNLVTHFYPNRWLAIPIMKNLFAYFYSRPAFHFYPAGATRSLYLVGKKCNNFFFLFSFYQVIKVTGNDITHTHASIFFFNLMLFPSFSFAEKIPTKKTDRI